jgi:hypothetical protein
MTNPRDMLNRGTGMKVVICGSILFVEKIMEVEAGLRKRGHDVVVPYSIIKHGVKNSDDVREIRERKGFNTGEKPYFTKRHFDEVKNGDAILVVNVEKNGIPDYIGGATFAEIMMAFHYGKKIFFLNPTPKHEKLALISDELEAVQPVILNGNLDLVK